MKLLKTMLMAVIGCLLSVCTFAQAYKSKTLIGKSIAGDTVLVGHMLADTAFNIVPGVTETDLSYINNKGEPMHVFILQADLNYKNIHLELLTPFNKPVTGRQTITTMIKYRDTTLSQVVAAVNGDFFNLDNGFPMGIAYKNGVAVKDTFTNNKDKPQQGVTFLGTGPQKRPFIGTANDGKGTWSGLSYAAGGGFFVVKDHQIVNQKITAVHPRTCVGVNTNNKLFFVVADGRNPQYSMGMDYRQMSEIMMQIGVKDAVNLDGGGSSEMVIRDIKKQSLQVRNKPSDGSERAISNAWGIVYTTKDN